MIISCTYYKGFLFGSQRRRSLSLPVLTLIFPALLPCLVRDSLCTALQTKILWINWSLNAIDTIETWVLGNLTALTERSQPAIRWTRGRGGESCVLRLFPWRTFIYLFGTMITGILLIGLGFALGYRRIQKTGTAVQSPTRLPVWLKLWEERSALRPPPPTIRLCSLRSAGPVKRVWPAPDQWLRDQMAACWAGFTSPVAMSCLCFCVAEVFFLFSHCTPQGA